MHRLALRGKMTGLNCVLFTCLNIPLALAGDGASKDDFLPLGATLEMSTIAPSLSVVLSHADDFIGAKVTLFGFLYGVTESHSALFISQDHALYGDLSSSVIVQNMTKHGASVYEFCGGQYVRVSGTLARVEGFMGNGLGKPLVIGEPTRVTRAQANGGKPKCWPQSRVVR